MRKRLAVIKGELAAFRDLEEQATEPLELDPELLGQVVEVFSSWASLHAATSGSCWPSGESTSIRPALCDKPSV